MRPAALGLLAGLVWLIASLGGARAQTGITFGSTIVWPAGWNMVSFGADTNFSGDVGAVGALYTLPPGATAYTVTNLSGVRVGTGYWVFFARRQLWLLRTASRQPRSVTVPARTCAMVANPGTAASARVEGADRVYSWSPLSNQYTQGSLVGVGRAVWACNDGDDGTLVTVRDEGDIITPDFPGCCRPEAVAAGGQVTLTVENASPYPLTAVMEPIDAQGNAPENATTYYAIEGVCGSCPEYGADGPSADTCDSAAEAQTFTAPAGRYRLHMQSDGRNVADLQTDISLQTNTAYHLCYFVDAGRVQQGLP